MIKMNTISRLFFVGALGYIIFAVLSLIVLNYPKMVGMLLNFLTILPVIFYVIRSSQNMPFKSLLYGYIIVHLLGISFNLYLTSTGLYIEHPELYSIYTNITSLIIMLYEFLVLYNLLKIASSFVSIVWWACMLNLIMIFSQSIVPILSIIDSDLVNQYSSFIINGCRNLSLALLYIAIGNFFCPIIKCRKH